MVEHERRRVLQYAGLAIAGGSLTTSAAAADEDDEPASIGEAAGWSSLGGNPGNNAISTESGPKAPVTVAWEYDRSGPTAVVDGTVYLTTGGEVHALDAADGSLEWKTGAIGASGTPAVTDEAVYVGGERLTRIERDGTLCCQADLGYDEAIPSPVVADGRVLVVAGGILCAVDARDLEVRWEFDPADGTLYEQPVAVGDGAVFAASESRLFARELADGAERWTDDDPAGTDEYSHFTAPSDRQVSHPVATDDVVAVGSVDSEPEAVWENGHVTLYDAETGVKRTKSESAITPGPVTDRRFFARSTHDLDGFDRETGENDWETVYGMYHVSSAVVADGTVYAGATVNGDGYTADEMPEPETGVYAFDENGEVEWAIATDERPSLALADGTIYASGETLLAIRPEANEAGDESDGEDDTGDDAPEDDGGDAEDGSGESDGDDGAAEPDDEPTNETEANGAEQDSGSDDVDGGNGTNDADEEGGISEGATNGTERTDDGSNSDAGEGDGDENASGEDANDGMPGFTAGAGIAGGALSLEWLRRRETDGGAGADDEKKS
ncbi:Pyrrolo-quinoline quinone beta-propeller repeat protein [Haloterrigena turkmenica DSM 5511]|uniref:Pyrrolo-quinoline quinone beta-propeller repeat protein n=1 Tax=Haloterrigena turkmenica (strain ATCC 51198 / DSM 5511 / JCM 9101 / NCIMB 13204 / VKM B-1734 / 4k) TaxID=543526 RepID=D2RU36_HALTV|nr:PQQ-binding-like beta-propeller repeat protein [Haloterrigena turkmenica]ADB59105.1 Pyrrolo-quinoline quinone beta-propeller repeat protein [Haloterrigena turkmenica DSM 5511]